MTIVSMNFFQKQMIKKVGQKQLVGYNLKEWVKSNSFWGGLVFKVNLEKQPPTTEIDASQKK